MARDGGANQAANQQMSQIQQDQVKRANAATDLFNTGLSTLKSGGSLGANPWADESYLRNLNTKTDAASSAANDTGVEALNNQALRTGSNSEANKATIADLARSKMRFMNEAQAGQAVADKDKNVDYQKFLLGSALAPAGVDTSMFGTATQGRDSALNNITSMANASQAMWGNIIGAGLQGAGAIGAAH